MCFGYSAKDQISFESGMAGGGGGNNLVVLKKSDQGDGGARFDHFSFWRERFQIIRREWVASLHYPRKERGAIRREYTGNGGMSSLTSQEGTGTNFMRPLFCRGYSTREEKCVRVISSVYWFP